MRIKMAMEAELDYVCAICLDPSIGKKSRQTMQKGMAARIRWIKQMLPKGLEIFFALEKPKSEKIKYKWAGEMLHSDLAVHGWVPKGLLESVPIEYALEPVKGKKSLFINCIWILPPFWHMGVAKDLIESFIQRAQQVGGASVLAFEGDKWFGTSIKYMPASFFKRFGFKEVARDGSRVLLFLDLGANEPPKLLSPKTRRYDEKDEITIDVLFNSQCPWSKLMVDSLKTNIKKYPVMTVNLVKTDDRKTIEEFGMARGVCINGDPVIRRMASWNEIRSEVEKCLKRP